MSDFEAILKAYEQAGGDPRFLRSPRVASLVVSGNKVLGANEVPGIEMEAEELPADRGRPPRPHKTSRSPLLRRDPGRGNPDNNL